jgi:hypothetical protein
MHAVRRLAAAGAIALAACAPELALRPATLQPGAAPVAPRRVAQDAVGESSAGYARSLPQGTRMEHAGRIAEGDVWRPIGLTLTVEGASIHEAYVVVSESRWIGFYLPVEKAYSPLRSHVALTLEAP